MTFSCIHSTSHAYFRSICPSCVCRGPCIAEVSQLQRTHLALHEGKCYGPRIFSFAASTVLNNLPKHL